MLDRRQQNRDRVYYGGLIAFNARSSTANCLIRNYSNGGAKLQLDTPLLVPDSMDIIIESKKIAFVADVVWRRGNEVGVVFRERIASKGETPLDWSIKLQACERAKHALQQRLDRLS